MPIDRRPLREQVREEVLTLLAQGEIEADEPINEGQLAGRLGVSRTPLREALITLENDGVIVSHSGKGFRFAPLSRVEFTELCQVLASLEMTALQTSDAETLAKVAPELLAKARSFTVEKASVETIDRNDDEWHALLLSGCANARLMDLITSVKRGLRRYEGLQVGQDAQLQRAAEEHQRIAQCLLDDDLPGALTALKHNWHSGMQRLLELMDGRLPAAVTGDVAVDQPTQRWWA